MLHTNLISLSLSLKHNNNNNINIMGNTSSSSSIKVISNDGTLQEFTHPLPASELTRKNPGYFVCDSNHLSVGCRIPALAAADELQPPRLYFLLPNDLLYSVLTEEEMVCFTCKAATTKRSNIVGRRILPAVLSELCLIPAAATEILEEEEKWRFDGGCCSDADEISWQRSWRPALDTIEEATCTM